MTSSSSTQEARTRSGTAIHALRRGLGSLFLPPRRGGDRPTLPAVRRHLAEAGRELPMARQAPPGNRYWGYSEETMLRFEEEGRLVYSRNSIPSYKRYLDEMPGQLLQDVWTDIPPISSRAPERLGTQPRSRSRSSNAPSRRAVRREMWFSIPSAVAAPPSPSPNA